MTADQVYEAIMYALITLAAITGGVFFYLGSWPLVLLSIVLSFVFAELLNRYELS